MQAVFKAVVEGDVPGVVSRLERKPGLLGAVATPPPLKFAGYAPLQVAIRSGLMLLWCVKRLSVH